MKRSLLPLFCILILAGCASAGNQKLADKNKQSID
jgi:PBP1b-binding outer membrane lipoprotein LpoB